jgi:hypothetical protein
MRQYLNLFLVVLMAGVLVLSGCATTNQAAVNRAMFVDAHPELSELMADAILNGQIMVGMTEEMVAAAWGKPTRVEAIEDEDAPTRWIYGNYFVGGNITHLYFGLDKSLVRYEVNYEPTHANNGTVSGDEKDTGVVLSGSGLLTKDSGSRP